ncbi:unnamed protein product [Paramecium sonneborni]|uniref:Protein kinase domain-containing protein n=1 Tax=Paramecium sonneborni TaxID=65129 RepID=A0A8S1KUF0_9CILI|nr:unnamed protein product [Paramecium sonneborni]
MQQMEQEEYEVIRKLGQYLFIKKIGQGFTGTVYKAFDIKERKLVAIKEIKKTNKNMDEEKLRKFIQNEKTILYLCKSKEYQNIIQVIDSFVTKDSDYIVLEYCSQNLSQYVDTLKQSQVNNTQYLSEQHAINILIQINQAMISLHENFIYHRDLKPGNILIKQGEIDEIKISDFGFSRVLLEEDLLKTGLGTKNYMAPEIRKGEIYNPKLSDMYSLGVILYEILCNHPHQIDEEFNFNLNPSLSEDMKNLIILMTKQNPQERLKWEDLGNQNALKNLNQYTQELNKYYLKLWENKINVLNCCLSDIEKTKPNHQNLKATLEVFENQLLNKTYNEIDIQLKRIERLDFEVNIKEQKKKKFLKDQEEVQKKIFDLSNSKSIIENRDYNQEKQNFENFIKKKEQEVDELKKKNQDDEFIIQKEILDELKSLEYKVKFCDDFDNDFFNVFAEQKIKNCYQQKFDMLLMQTQYGLGQINNFFRSLQLHTYQSLRNESQILIQQNS